MRTKLKINPVAVALAAAVQKMDRSTGLSHSFVVQYRTQAQSAQTEEQSVAVIALNWADAWGLIGDAMGLFMNGPEGRTVTSVTALLY